MTDRVTIHNLPTSLDGHKIHAYSVSHDQSRALVLMHRDGELLPWLTATWFPNCGNGWLWGTSFSSFEQADAYRSAWIETHGTTETRDLIKQAKGQKQ